MEGGEKGDLLPCDLFYVVKQAVASACAAVRGVDAEGSHLSTVDAILR